ncbi:MAG: IS200/IS605 family transposase [Ardenticatenales bacterium]|nr:IS200/IS605 family transposase [Ardenticatenales bacterium]
MPSSHTNLVVHLVWSTWDRLPLITPDLEPHIHRSIAMTSRDLGCEVIAVNGTADHVHVLVRIPTILAVAAIVHRLKGASSYRINRRPGGVDTFRWQGHYSAFSVSRWDVDRITAYIRSQKTHHADGTIQPHLERADDEHPTNRDDRGH